MKKIILAGVTLVMMGVSASAADLNAGPYTKAPALVSPTTAYDWSGFYAGVNGGGGWGESNWFYPARGTSTHPHLAGGFAGGQIGYNWQFAPSWVVGLEADGDWADIDGTAPCPNPRFSCKAKTDALASFRGRVGYAVNNWLIYGTGGLGYTNNHYSADNGVSLDHRSMTGDQWGYAAGAGVEWGFAPSWSAKVEYMHYGLDRHTSNFNNALELEPLTVHPNIDTVKGGINYHFNWGAPVAAAHY